MLKQVDSIDAVIGDLRRGGVEFLRSGPVSANEPAYERQGVYRAQITQEFPYTSRNGKTSKLSVTVDVECTTKEASFVLGSSIDAITQTLLQSIFLYDFNLVNKSGDPNPRLEQYLLMHNDEIDYIHARGQQTQAQAQQAFRENRWDETLRLAQNAGGFSIHFLDGEQAPGYSSQLIEFSHDGRKQCWFIFNIPPGQLMARQKEFLVSIMRT